VRRREEVLEQEAADSLRLLNATFESRSHNCAANGVTTDLMQYTRRVE
jgi:hypothetical protein